MKTLHAENINSHISRLHQSNMIQEATNIPLYCNKQPQYPQSQLPDGIPTAPQRAHGSYGGRYG